MLFVDGESLALRGQKLAAREELILREGPYSRRNAFVWLPDVHALKYPLIEVVNQMGISRRAESAFYYNNGQGRTFRKRFDTSYAIWDSRPKSSGRQRRRGT